MRLSNFMEGLVILAGYFKDIKEFHIRAEHDIFYVYATDEPLSVGDYARLRQLGWLQHEVDDDEPYNPKKGWSCYTS